MGVVTWTDCTVASPNVRCWTIGNKRKRGIVMSTYSSSSRLRRLYETGIGKPYIGLGPTGYKPKVFRVASMYNTNKEFGRIGMFMLLTVVKVYK